MKIKTIGILVVFFLIPWLITTAEGGREAHRVGKRVALIIGNSAYRGEMLGVLTNPVNDADDVAKALRKFGFDVKTHKDLGKSAMDEAIADFGRRASHADAALFYFAGHGVQIKSQNYLMPIDATAKSEAAVGYEGVNVNYILEELDHARSGINLVMLDACRNNAFTGKFRGGKTRGLAAPVDVPKSTVMVYATDPGNVAADGEGRNGLFTAGLLAGFKSGKNEILSLDNVLLKASNYVEEKSEKKQTPYVNGPLSVLKQFMFRVDVVEGVEERARRAYDYIKDSGDPKDYAAFLENEEYAKTTYGGYARNRLEKLMPVIPKVEPSPTTVVTTQIPPAVKVELAQYYHYLHNISKKIL